MEGGDAGIEDEGGVFIDDGAEGLKLAEEAVELGVAAVGCGVKRGGFGFGVAADLLGLALGIGDEAGGFFVGFRLHGGGLGTAFGAEFGGLTFALGTHAAEDGFGVCLRELDAGDAGGEKFHAELGERVRGGKGEDVVLDGGQIGGGADGGDEFGEFVGADDGIARGGDEGIEFLVSERDTADGVVIGERLRDSPGVEDGDDDVALVFGEGLAEANFGMLEAAVDADDALDRRRKTRIETGLGEGADGLAEADDDGFLCLTDDESAGGNDDGNAHREDEQGADEGDAAVTGRFGGFAHWLSEFSVLRTLSGSTGV